MKHKERSAFLLHHTDMQAATRCLDDAHLGLLLRMLYRHSIGEQVEEDLLPMQVLPLFMLFADKITRDAVHYEETCARQRRNAEKRWQKQREQETDDPLDTVDTTVYHCMPNIPTEKETVNEKENVNENIKEKEGEIKGKRKEAAPQPPFVPPAPEAVTLYAGSLGAQFDGQRFCDYYAAKGWMVGTSPMQDWHAAVRAWVQDDMRRPPPAPRRTSAQQYTQRAYREQDLRFDDDLLMQEAAQEKF